MNLDGLRAWGKEKYCALFAGRQEMIRRKNSLIELGLWMAEWKPEASKWPIVRTMALQLAAIPDFLCIVYISFSHVSWC